MAITPFLILHAFSSGTAALTGIEAISNGITAFKEPRSKNAGITLSLDGFILACLFLGISFLTSQIGAVPSEFETVISQLARTVFGGQGIFIFAVILATTIILDPGGEYCFRRFPASERADGKGWISAPPADISRQPPGLFAWHCGAGDPCVVFDRILFQASVTRLIPLYAIGVFLSFTLSQFGMALRWWKSGSISTRTERRVAPIGFQRFSYDPLWRLKMITNGFGALCTGVVMMVFAVTKFNDGA